MLGGGLCPAGRAQVWRAGCGMWEMAPDQLERYREAVDDTVPERSAVVEERGSRRASRSWARRAEDGPRGYPKDHPRIELLRYKGLVTWRSWPVAAGSEPPRRRTGW